MTYKHPYSINHSDNEEYITHVKSCHVFVSSDVDNKIIDELTNSNYCVHYGYNIDELCKIKTKYLENTDDKKSTLHICIVMSFVHNCERRFLKSSQFQDIIHSGICITVIDSVYSNIFSHAVSSKFDIVVAHIKNIETISDLYSNYSSSADIYCEYNNDMTMPNIDNMNIQVLKIDSQSLNKFEDVLICNKVITDHLKSCFTDLSELACC